MHLVPRLGELVATVGEARAQFVDDAVGECVKRGAALLLAADLERLLEFARDSLLDGGDYFGRDYFGRDRKSTRLNSSHITISYAVFCLKKKKQKKEVDFKQIEKSPVDAPRLRLIPLMLRCWGSEQQGVRYAPMWRAGEQCYFFFNDTATTEIYTLSLHDALPISTDRGQQPAARQQDQLIRHPILRSV